MITDDFWAWVSRGAAIGLGMLLLWAAIAAVVGAIGAIVIAVVS